MKLPPPRESSDISVEQALARRKTARTYARRAMKLEHLGQLLWAAQGVTHGEGYRTAPSAGAMYPLDVYAIVGKVAQVDAGVYRYDPPTHSIEPGKTGDLRKKLVPAAAGQDWVADAPLAILITAVFERSAAKYGDRAERFAKIEAGLVGQGVCLQAAALGLGSAIVGAFYDDQVNKLLDLPADHQPLCFVIAGEAYGM